MEKYPKIQSVFKRQPEKPHRFIDGDYSQPEFEYLADCGWLVTEKINGTTIRVNYETDTERVRFGGRTNESSIPAFLYDKLQELFPVQKVSGLIDVGTITFFGEGYGNKIEKVGSQYISDGVNFILFDVMVGGWWLKWPDVKNVAKRMGIDVVPRVTIAPVIKLPMIIDFVREGFESALGSLPAEGVVCRPMIDLTNRAGERIITKIKTKDFV